MPRQKKNRPSSYRHYLRDGSRGVPRSTENDRRRREEKLEASVAVPTCLSPLNFSGDAQAESFSGQGDTGTLHSGHPHQSHITSECHPVTSAVLGLTEAETMEVDRPTMDEEPIQDDNSGSAGRKFQSLLAEGNQPISPGLPCTKGQLLSLTMAFVARHQLNKVATQDLLTLLNHAVPNCVPQTKYYLEKYFYKSESVPVENHFYCSHNDCQQYLGKQEAIEGRESLECDACGGVIDTEGLVKSENYFLTKSLRGQLKEMLETDGIFEIINKNKQTPRTQTSRGEIYTGSEYHNVEIQNFLKSGDNFTISFNTDGVPIFGSSNFSLWPIVATINELPFQMKSNFHILSTLWFGNGKPKSAETLLRPFVEEIQDVFLNGFEWQDSEGNKRVSRVACLLCVCDSPARSFVMNFTQYNGFFGCEKCMHRGESVAKGDGHVRVFPLTLPQPCERTHEETVTIAERVGRSTVQSECGVKGPSALLGLPCFDIIKGTPTDYMHCCILGVGRQFMSLWLDNTGSPYYIKDAAKLIDDVLVRIKPPEEIKRLPRSLEQNRKFLKASEIRAFILFYSPVILSGLLPSPYYAHWMLFVNMMRLILRKEIHPGDIVTAKLLAFKFVHGTEELYGAEHVSYNVHQLVHVVEGIDRWGAPWAYSGFVYEDLLGLLKKMFSGTRYVAQQIFNSFTASRAINQYAENFIPFATDEVQDFYEELASNRSKVRASLLPEVCLGKGEVVSVGTSAKFAIEQRLQAALRCNRAVSYSRLCINGKLYSTALYSEKYKRNNAIVQLRDGSVFSVIDILQINLSCACLDGAGLCHVTKSAGNHSSLRHFLVGYRLPLETARQTYDEYCDMDLTGFINKVSFTPADTRLLQAIRSCDIIGKCILIEKNSSTFCIKSDVRFEKD